MAQSLFHEGKIDGSWDDYCNTVAKIDILLSQTAFSISIQKSAIKWGKKKPIINLALMTYQINFELGK